MRVYKGIQEYIESTKVYRQYRSIQGYTSIYKGSQGYEEDEVSEQTPTPLHTQAPDLPVVITERNFS